jgi:hypothetical protein
MQNAMNRSYLYLMGYILAFAIIVQPNLWSQQAIVDGNYLIGYSIYGKESSMAFPIEFTYSWVRIPSIVGDYFFSNVFGETVGYLMMRLLPLMLIIAIAARISFLRQWQIGFIFIATPLFLTPGFWQVIGNDYHYGLATLALTISVLMWVLVNFETSRRINIIANISQGLFISILLLSGIGIPFVLSFALAALILAKERLKFTIVALLQIVLSSSTFIILFSFVSGFYFGHFNPLGALLKWTSFYSKSGIWEYWNTPGYSWLNYSPSLLAFPILIFSIYFLRKTETDIQVKKISDFLTLAFLPLFIYYLVSQFILSTTMGLFELSFQVIMLLSIPLLNFGILSASRYQKISFFDVSLILIPIFVAVRLLPRYKFLVFWNGLVILCIAIALVISFARPLHHARVRHPSPRSNNPQRADRAKKLQKSYRLKNLKVLRAQVFSWSTTLLLLVVLAFGHTSSVIPNAANIWTPDYSRIFGFSDLNYKDWKRDVALADWTLNEINSEPSLRSYTWLIPRKRGDTYVRFSNSAWSAAGTLMWGNGQYTVNNSKFGSGSVDPEFANRVKSEKKIRVFVIGESKENVATARRDIIQGDARIETENCKDFKDGVGPIHVCKFTLASI